MTNADYITNKLVLGTMFQHLFPAKDLLLFLLVGSFRDLTRGTTHELNLISLDTRADGYCIGAPRDHRVHQVPPRPSWCKCCERHDSPPFNDSTSEAPARTFSPHESSENTGLIDQMH